MIHPMKSTVSMLKVRRSEKRGETKRQGKREKKAAQAAFFEQYGKAEVDVVPTLPA